MKISVLIVAHNEEENIRACIESILNQSHKPDEIILVAHNCTDKTVSIAKEYPDIETVEYVGPAGIPYARIKGFEVVIGDIIACIDGDSAAKTNWLKNITKPLIKNSKISIVGGRLIMTNSFLWRLAMLRQFIRRKFIKDPLSQFASGANFACRKIDYEKVGGIKPIIDLKEKLNLYFWAEDYYISQALKQVGKLHIAWNAVIYSHMSKDQESMKAQIELVPKWNHDNTAILNYFKNLKRKEPGI